MGRKQPLGATEGEELIVSLVKAVAGDKAWQAAQECLMFYCGGFRMQGALQSLNNLLLQHPMSGFFHFLWSDLESESKNHRKRQ